MNTQTEITNTQPVHKCSTCGEPFPENSCGVCPNCFDVGEGFPAEPELEPIPDVRNIEVWARIKQSSKYYHQGLSDPTNSKSAKRFFKLSHFTPLPALRPELGTALSRDSYVLHFNGNAYRIEDVELYLRDSKDGKRFLRIL